jgi:hypothetical protein
MSKGLVTALAVVFVALVLFAVIYFPVVYAPRSSGTQPPAGSVGLREFTTEAGQGLAPWCVTTRYSIAYVNEGVEGPWSPFSGDVQSLSRTYPLIGMSAPPDSTWDIVVQREEVTDEGIVGPYAIAPQWRARTAEGWEFVDMANPCKLAYTPPAPSLYPVPLGDPSVPTFAAESPPETPWCVGTKYRSAFLGAFQRHGPWSAWSQVTWYSLGASMPTFRVAPPPPDQAELKTYWVPDHVLLRGSPPRLRFTIVRTSGTTDYNVNWPFDATVTTATAVSRFASSTFLRFGANVQISVDFQREQAAAFVFLDTTDTSPDVTQVRLSGAPDDILTAIGFGAQAVAQDEYQEAVSPVPFLYSFENGNVFVPEHECDPFEVQVDRNNLCVEEVELPQPAAPTAEGFTVNLAG